MIPKKIHFIWVGDESKRPDNCIETWIRHNPDYEIKIWGNSSLVEHKWLNASHMQAMSTRELNGVADMMRWEILHSEGGIVLDADSVCLRPLDDDLLNCEAFACWESEIVRPGLIAAGYFGCCSGNSFVHKIMVDIHNETSVTHDLAWKTVGPQRLTDSYRRYQYFDLRIFPSHYFIPEHFSGIVYKGQGPVYANQMWGSTKGSYGELHLQKFDGVVNNPDVTVAAPTTTVQAPIFDRNPSMFEARHDPYFVQHVQVSSDVINHNRVDVFKKLCSGQRVLHIGCADWPIQNPNTSLHLALEPVCAKLDGFDIHAEALAALAPHAKGKLFSKFQDLTSEYDLILVPEVMEHVADVSGFLAQLHSLNARSYAITVPDAYQCYRRHFDYQKDSETFTEIVHPDHNCWYTPYTFTNVVNKYTPWTIEGMWFFNSMSLLMLATKSPPTLA
jgi:mannosyltransferase OCH1-like enzyme